MANRASEGGTEAREQAIEPARGPVEHGPLGTWIRKTIAVRIWRRLKRQGPRTVARKIAHRLIRPMAQRYTAWRMWRRPWVGDNRPVFLMVSHVGGGGTEKHVRDLMHRLRTEQVRPLLFRPDGTGRLVCEEHSAEGGLTWCRSVPMRGPAIDGLLRLVKPKHVHVHHTMGHPAVLFDRLHARGFRPDWTLHDYHAICPRIHLQKADGSYCGEPDAAGCNQCLSVLGDYHGRAFRPSIEDWRRQFAGLLQHARSIYVPSDDMARRLARHAPGLPVRVRPHFDDLGWRPDVVEPYRSGQTVRVAVIGAIVSIKGSDRLRACAEYARNAGLPLEFEVIGPTDRDRELALLGNVRVLGPYRETEVFDHLQAARCHLAWLPSVWPETFMYTLSVAMAAGLYTVCFDLGAQAERVRDWGHGQALPLSSSAATIAQTLIEAAQQLAGSSMAAPRRPDVAYTSLLNDYYQFLPDERVRLGLPPGPRVESCPTPHFSTRTIHARLH